MPACNVCKAHKETIEALKMVIQAQNQSLQLLSSLRTTPETGGNEVAPDVAAFIEQIGAEISPKVDKLPRMWANEDEEEVLGLLAAGEIEPDECERRLAALQAGSPPYVSLVR